ncbi:DUF4191 domain-containing protein [Segniliparus rugosus]|uniref:DUF4191 domain-containing protein n=1 Tax=Segniliparus rugosus (strain ATCC BAA-974 / DSM 45345 / CCUG 50838 / CIP 108380 / JCM 13579 / CDC 945) TaxID=679197 RepID=E5XRE0_SEGRC|nr:DUF4191 domain-containing protein [Segniliparus rugosus]EFV13073.1 hypothetical protein HMPREF9336_02062 [Segniliparus rugosus ATCC BAA-974]
MPKPPASTSKEAKAAARLARKRQSKERRQQLWQAFNLQRREDRWLLPLMIGALVLGIAIGFGIGLATGGIWFFTPLGVLGGLIGAFVVFSRRIQRTAYANAEGKTGAASWVLEQLRGAWRITPGVAANGQFDVVHRVVGRPGVILVGEGVATRTRGLVSQEKRKIAKLVGDTPIYEVIVGNEEGDIPLSKLQRHILRLPNNIDTKRMDALEAKFAALGARPTPLPKGPLPQGAKMRNLQRATRRTRA